MEYYECRGKEIVIEGRFTNESPWMIPISISSLHGSQIMEISRDYYSLWKEVCARRLHAVY